MVTLIEKGVDAIARYPGDPMVVAGLTIEGRSGIG
jgi:hypothetical protein